MSWIVDRIEVWTDLQCNSGVAKADLPIGDAAALVIEEEITQLLVSRVLTVAIPTIWVDSAEVIARRVLVVRYTDATGGSSGLGWDEFRISNIVKTVGRDGLTTITALGIEYDLGERDTPVYVTASTVVSYNVPVYSFEISNALTTYVIAGLPAYWSLGTVTPTGPAVATLSGDTRLSAARKLVAAVNKASGAVYEISARPNGITGYYLDVTAYGASATVPDLMTNKNLQGVTRTERTDQQTTRCVTIGSGGGFGRPHYRITAVTLNTHIEVVDMASGEGPVRETDQFLNKYIVDDGNATHLITGSSRQSSTTSRFTMTATAGLVVGEICSLVNDTSFNEMPYLDSPGLQTTWGIKLGFLTLPNDRYTNVVLNGDMHLWTGASPGTPDNLGETSWSTTGTASTRILSLFQTGGVSALVPISSSLVVTNAGPYVVVGDVLTYTAIIQIVTMLGSTNILRFNNPVSGANEDHLLDGSVAGLDQQGVWLAYSTSYTMTGAVAPAKLASGPRASIVTAGAFPTYWDSFSITKSSAAVPWRLGSGPATMIQAANVHFGTNGAPLVEYAIDCIDLHRVDPDGAGRYERLSLGGSANLTETELGETTTQRVLKVRTNHRAAHDTQLTLANSASQLTRILVAA